MKKKGFFITISSLLLCTCVAGCMTSITSSAQAVYNHHNLQNSLHDQYLAVQVDRAVHWKTEAFKKSRVNVSVFRDLVILTGQVESPEIKQQLTEVVKAVPSVHEVYNLTSVNNPVSSLTKISDSWITTKIKSMLLVQQEIDPSEIKVITENGTVFLIGTIYPDQAQIATDIARGTDGVQNVVRVFSYLHVSKSMDKA